MSDKSDAPILVIDDQAEVRRLLRTSLEVDGYSEALSAGNPFNAQVSAGTDEMDIVKARLAGIDGWELVGRLRYR